jgi:DNA-directed RNA polymerase subunit RPC12/RpoP
MSPSQRFYYCLGSDGVTVPNWVLDCVNCRKQFVYSKIADDVVLSIYPAAKPEFSPGGDELECPHCHHKAIYQRRELTYRALSGLRVYQDLCI